MKIGVSATSPGLDAQIDPRFGRCQYFIIVDSDAMSCESCENASMAASGGAGIQAAQFIANKGVEVVLTGNVGPNAHTTLEAAGIRIITGVNGTVRDAVEAYKRGALADAASGPAVQSYYGMDAQGQSPNQGVARDQGRGMGRGMGAGRNRGGCGSGMGRGAGGGQGRRMG